MTAAGRDREDDGAPGSGSPAAGSQRIDKWLWHARVAKSRTLSATLVTEGKVRVNGVKVLKAAHGVKSGDTITIVMRQRMRVLKVAGMAERRGSAEVAAKLFEDLSPPPPPKSGASGGDVGAQREPGSGRPTKRERRAIISFK